jgi:hypothetical protein
MPPKKSVSQEPRLSQDPYRRSEYQSEFINRNVPNATKVSEPESSPIKSNSDDSIFLFIVVHTLNNNQITAKIVNVFESLGRKNEQNSTFQNGFKLGRTYGKEDEFDFTLNDTNYITVETEGTLVQSKIKKQENFEINRNHAFNQYTDFEQLVEIRENQCIFFYEYDVDEGKQGTYYTKGSIFKYKNGIGSTASIQKLDDYNLGDFEHIKEIILEDNVFKKIVPNKPVVPKLPINSASTSIETSRETSRQPSIETSRQPSRETSRQPNLNIGSRVSATPKNINPKISESRGPSKKFIKLGGGAPDPLTVQLQKKCEDVIILYANAILPDVLFQIIEKKGLSIKPNVILKSIINQLYIDISAPKVVSEFQLYNKLYDEINMYYRDKNQLDSKKYNNELKKELTQFESKLKINKYINLMNETRKKMNIGTTYEDVYFSMHIVDFLDFLDFRKRFAKDENMEKLIIKILDNSFVKNTSKVLPLISDDIKLKLEETTQGVYTYLKISNFQEGNSNFNSPYNQRFNIKLNFFDERSIIMEYSNINFGFYNKNTSVNLTKIKKVRDNRITLKTEFDQKTQKIKELREIEKIDYDGKYTFGNFNKVFNPRYTVKDIANELSPLVEKVANGKPLFLMGWGASGSGKTSTLISLVKKNEPGILIYLCNALGNLDYTRVTLECKEFFKPYYVDAKYPVLQDGSLLVESGPFNFVYDEKEKEDSNMFKLAARVDHKSKHVYRTKEETKVFEANENIGNVVKFLIDDDRLVKATTNNPNSSRSHVLCFLKFAKNDKKEANIIIGDLAGVENKFDCANPTEISKFFNIKRDGTNERFYKNEITDDGKVDAIYGGNPQELGQDKSKFQTSLDQSFFVFDPENILKLYKYDTEESNFGEIKFKSREAAITMFVNQILFFVKNLNIGNLNQRVLTMDKSKIDNASISFDINNNVLTSTIRKMIYGSSKKYEDVKIDANTFNLVWNKKNVDILLNKIKESILYNKVISNVCKHRVVEGSFINESLNNLSKDIVNIINFKNKDMIYYVPSFQDSCLPAYCPTRKMCFTTDKNNFDIQSVIMEEIYKYIGGEKETFYENIEFCVFCVFNWSRTANNPPPVAYVDINYFKQMIYSGDQATFNMEEFKKELQARIKHLEQYKFSPGGLKVLREINGIVNVKKTIDDETKENIKEKLSIIDNTNATTSVGTIEFIDKISKLNSISNSCFNNKDEKDYMYIYSQE